MRTARSVVAEWYEHLDAGRYEQAIRLLTDDARWWISGDPGLFPPAGWMDRRSAMATLTSSAGLFESLRMRAVAFTCDGNRVAVESESAGRTRSGESFTFRYHNVFVLSDERISEIREYCDTLQIWHLLLRDNTGVGTS